MSQVVLYQFPRFGPLPSMSPYCWKVQLALAARGVAHETRDLLLAKKANPRGKLPYLAWDGEGIEDSTAIVRAIDQRADGPPTLVPADPQQAAEAHILEDWADESLYWHGVYAKFVDDDGFDHIKPLLAKSAPGPTGLIAPSVVRRKLASAVSAQGLSRRAPALIMQEYERHLDALDHRLDGRDYLVGNRLSIADVAVVPMVAQLSFELTPKYAAQIARRERLARYLVRVREQLA